LDSLAANANNAACPKLDRCKVLDVVGATNLQPNSRKKKKKTKKKTSKIMARAMENRRLPLQITLNCV